LRYSAPGIGSIDESTRDSIRQRKGELLELLSRTEALSPSGGSGMAGPSVLMAATARMVPAQKRGIATGIVNTGGSFGQFLMAPLAGALSVGAISYGLYMVLQKKILGQYRPLEFTCYSFWAGMGMAYGNEALRILRVVDHWTAARLPLLLAAAAILALLAGLALARRRRARADVGGVS